MVEANRRLYLDEASGLPAKRFAEWLLPNRPAASPLWVVYDCAAPMVGDPLLSPHAFHLQLTKDAMVRREGDHALLGPAPGGLEAIGVSRTMRDQGRPVGKSCFCGRAG
jgi:hypothetical protein